MDRLEVIQALIKAKSYKSYLEIGVLGGSNFFPVRCRRKTAVDPKFIFNWKGILGEILRNPYNINARYYRMTSDEFFAKTIGKPGCEIDIALVDGMHEFAFALRDVYNIMSRMTRGGSILLHDCNPTTVEASCSFSDWATRGFSGFWNGDVWKCIYYLRLAHPDLNIFVADSDHGLGVIEYRGEHLEMNKKLVGEVNKLTYEDLQLNRTQILNLKPKIYLKEFLAAS